jgi:hypothetical protein
LRLTALFAVLAAFIITIAVVEAAAATIAVEAGAALFGVSPPCGLLLCGRATGDEGRQARYRE